MAVVTISSDEITSMTGLKKAQVLEGLNDLGMPSEEDGGEIFVEVTPNRPDFFSIEGIARALNSFYGKKPAQYCAKKSNYTAAVDSSVMNVRPYFVCAIVKNVKMDESLLKSLIQLQEKLHDTIGRKRKKVAIGIHNADSVVFPLSYKAVKDERFVPLDFENEMSAKEMLNKHPKGVAYAHLVGALCPMLYDQEGVLSFPPIINSERTRVSESTKNLLIEITGSHLGTLQGVLNIIVCALSDRGGEIYDVSVGKETYPKLEPMKMDVDEESINKLLGEELSKKQIFSNLEIMGWTNDSKTKVFVPPFRMDVSHYADIAEDVAIAHGYNNFKTSLPNFFTSGSMKDAGRDVREALVGMGFIEVVNYVLANRSMLEKLDGGKPLEIINPKTEDFTLFRTNVAVSLLDNISNNKSQELPIKIFEIGRVYDGSECVRLGFAISAETLDFSAIRGVMQTLTKTIDKNIELRKTQNKLFVSGRGAEITLNGSKVGIIGEVSPNVLEHFGIENPVGVCEIELGKFL